MKKSILSATVMSAVILTTTACGGNTAVEHPTRCTVKETPRN